MNTTPSPELIRSLDAEDPLASFRSEFDFPQHDGQDVVYLCGNSLGLRPKKSLEYVNQEFDDWKRYGVEGHFQAKNPWFSYHRSFREPLARLVGALPTEVVCMNSLTVNVHLMLSSFYRPKDHRRKILILGNEFPSDRYAVESHVRLMGLDPSADIIELQPASGSFALDTDAVLQVIHDLGDTLALMHCSAVHYYTGQLLDIARLTEAAQKNGALVGWDLAHAIGNVPLHLHDWNVDYAAWCSYKYLNSGPGGVGGAYIHERHCQNPDIIRLAGWWGNDENTRFTMPQWFHPVPTADSWQLSNAPVFSMAIHRAALESFERAGMQALREKSALLSTMLMNVIDAIGEEFPLDRLHIITPRPQHQRGAQVSTIASRNGRAMFEYLSAHGIVTDWRNPDVIRMAPAPLYCSFADIQRFADVLRHYCESQE